MRPFPEHGMWTERRHLGWDAGEAEEGDFYKAENDAKKEEEEPIAEPGGGKIFGLQEVATKKAVVKRAVVKKGKTTKEAVQAQPPGQKTTRFKSPVYGKCKIYSAEKRSYVQWQRAYLQRS